MRVTHKRACALTSFIFYIYWTATTPNRMWNAVLCTRFVNVVRVHSRTGGEVNRLVVTTGCSVCCEFIYCLRDYVLEFQWFTIMIGALPWSRPWHQCCLHAVLSPDSFLCSHICHFLYFHLLSLLLLGVFLPRIPVAHLQYHPRLELFKNNYMDIEKETRMYKSVT